MTEIRHLDAVEQHWPCSGPRCPAVPVYRIARRLANGRSLIRRLCAVHAAPHLDPTGDPEPCT